MSEFKEVVTKKSSRIKGSFGSSAEVFHRWANQTQDRAKSKNVFFEGTKIYSYGYHYLLGEIVTFNGVKVAIINGNRYSVTTAKHQGQAKAAASHLPCIRSLDGTVLGGIKDKQNELIDALSGFFNRRQFWYDSLAGFKECWLLREVDEFNDLCEKLGLSEYLIKINQEYIELMWDHVQLCKELDKPRQEAKRLERERLQAHERALQEAKLADWHAGKTNVTLWAVTPQQIRIKDDTVETTSGARVPLRDAVLFLAKLEAGNAKVGESIGSYTYNGIDANGIVTIGCHKISLEHAKQVFMKGDYNETK